MHQGKCGDLDDDQLRSATGIEVVRVDPDEVVTAWREVPAERIEVLEEQVRAEWHFEEDVEREESLNLVPDGLL